METIGGDGDCRNGDLGAWNSFTCLRKYKEGEEGLTRHP